MFRLSAAATLGASGAIDWMDSLRVPVSGAIGAGYPGRSGR